MVLKIITKNYFYYLGGLEPGGHIMTNDLFFDSNQSFDNIESTKNKSFKGLFVVGLTGNIYVLWNLGKKERKKMQF